MKSSSITVILAVISVFVCSSSVKTAHRGGLRFTWHRGGHTGASLAKEKTTTSHAGALFLQFAEEKPSNFRGIPVKVHNGHGVFGGTDFLIDSLFKDLDSGTVQKINKCAVGMKGDTRISADSHVWIIVNGEDSTGEEMAQMAMDADPNARILLLGNMWSDKNESRIVRQGRVTNMWLPFASTHFAERRFHTPMDLYDRSRLLSKQKKKEQKKGLLAYMHRHCVREREVMFSSLDNALCTSRGTGASALSECHGNSPRRCATGYSNSEDVKPTCMNSTFVNCSSLLSRYDTAVGKYEDFQFVLAMEHRVMNERGYMTEKMVDAMLAGAIPISDSGSQRKLMFRPDSYIAADPLNETSMHMADEEMKRLLSDSQAYDAMRLTPAVTEQQLRDYFSWHPAVWTKFGDSLRWKIVWEILRLCE